MEKSSELAQLLVSLSKLLEVGRPIGHRNLTLVPLFGTSPTVDYLLGQEAIQDGVLTVKEVSDSGDVNVLLVENKGNRRVLLLDGEELVGAKQNRILNTTILIEAGTTQKIPVSCVEQGRWRHTSKQFVSGTYAPPRMRSRKSRAVGQSYARCGAAISDQSQVWSDVDEMVSALHTKTPTRAMKDVFDQRAADFEGFVKALPYPAGARGVMAAVSGQFTALDALDKAASFERIWTRLVTGYAVDAVRQRNQDARPFSERNARGILDSLAACRVARFKAVGLGSELRFESDQVLGQALVVDDVLVHMSVFPNEQQHRGTHDSGGHIMPPSFRRRPRREP